MQWEYFDTGISIIRLFERYDITMAIINQVDFIDIERALQLIKCWIQWNGVMKINSRSKKEKFATTSSNTGVTLTPSFI